MNLSVTLCECYVVKLFTLAVKLKYDKYYIDVVLNGLLQTSVAYLCLYPTDVCIT